MSKRFGFRIRGREGKMGVLPKLDVYLGNIYS